MSNGLRIASVYLPNGNPQPGPKFDYKLAWFERLIAHAGDALRDVPVALAGDFTSYPPTRTSTTPAVAARRRASAATREAYRRLLAQGWTDAIRNVHPRGIYTFGSTPDAFRRNAGFRMDFLLVSPRLAPRLARTGVDFEHRGRDKPSDHAPVWLVIHLRAEGSV